MGCSSSKASWPEAPPADHKGKQHKGPVCTTAAPTPSAPPHPGPAAAAAPQRAASGQAEAAAAPALPADAVAAVPAEPSVAWVAVSAEEEEERLAALHELGVEYGMPDPRFDSIVRLVKGIFQAELCAVSLLEAEKLVLMARAGEAPDCTPRKGSFCELCLQAPQPQVTIIEDLLLDARTASHPFVLNAPGLRFYAGAPLLATNGGHIFGTLCVLSSQPRHFSAEQYAILAHFAEMVTRELERDWVVRRQQELLQRLKDKQLRALDCFSEALCFVDCGSPGWPILYSNDAWREAAGGLLPAPAAAAAGEPPLQAQGQGVGRAPPGTAGRSTPRRERFWEVFAPHDLVVDDATPAASAGSAGSARTAGSAASSGTGRATVAALQAEACRAAAAQQAFWVLASRRDSSGSGGGCGSGAAGRDSGTAVGGGSAAGSGGSADGVLHVHFKPAAGAEPLSHFGPGLEAGGARIGVPAYIDSGGGNGASSASGVEQQQQQPAEPGSAAGPCYYFAAIRQQELPTQPAAGPARRGSIDGGCCISSDWGGAQLLRSRSAMPSSGDSAPTWPPPEMAAGRPKVMEEVQLGPLLGTGACGSCYRGSWRGTQVAVKVIECVYTPGQEEPKGAGRGPMWEAVLGRTLAHPHIVQTFDWAVGPQTPIAGGRLHCTVWIIQAFCNRGTLADGIKLGLLRGTDGRPNLRAILQTASDIAGAMAYLHSNGVIHGDLSPSNVLLKTADKDSRRWIAQVADFGLSRLAGGGQEGRINTDSFRTITHMPPELLMDGEVSPATDVYSFGVLLHEAWAGERAWKGMSKVALLAGLLAGTVTLEPHADAPPELQELMARCVDRESSKRPSFTQVLDTLHSLLVAAIRPGGGQSKAPTN